MGALMLLFLFNYFKKIDDTMQHKTTGKIVVFYLKIHFGNFMIRKIL